jgi:hypothetical protein
LDPEAVLNFLIGVNQICEVKLIPEVDFLAVLITRTSGRIMQIFGAHLEQKHPWGLVQSEIIATFLPPRVKERFLSSYVLDRFQRAEEDLTSFVMSVGAAAGVLGFPGTEQQLVHRMLQNMHPRNKSYCLFEARPDTVQGLYRLASTVAEACAVESQREQQMGLVPQAAAPRPLVSSVLKTSAPQSIANREMSCWKCGGKGHIARYCRQSVTQLRGSEGSENADGARP